MTCHCNRLVVTLTTRLYVRSGVGAAAVRCGGVSRFSFGSYSRECAALRLGCSSHDLNPTMISQKRQLFLIYFASSTMLSSRILRSTVTLSSRPSPVTTRQCLKIVSVFPQQQQQRFYTATPTPTDELKRTPLNNLHIANGARMVPFAGYSMPVLYSDQGVGDSHKFVREKAGLFDVSHMVQHRFVVSW